MVLVGFLCVSEPVSSLVLIERHLYLAVLIPSSSEVTYVKMPGIINARKDTGNAQEGNRNQQSSGSLWEWESNSERREGSGLHGWRSQTFTLVLGATVGVSA